MLIKLIQVYNCTSGGLNPITWGQVFPLFLTLHAFFLHFYTPMIPMIPVIPVKIIGYNKVEVWGLDAILDVAYEGALWSVILF